MEVVFCRWVFAFAVGFFVLFSIAYSGKKKAPILQCLDFLVLRNFVSGLCEMMRIAVKNVVENLNGSPKVRAVNLGGWLVVEGWIKPSLFDDIPNGDMLVSLSVRESSHLFVHNSGFTFTNAIV